MSNVKCLWQNGYEGCILNHQTSCEATSISDSSLITNLKEKIFEVREIVIDAFENLVLGVTEKTGKLSHYILLSETKNSIQDNFEMSLVSGREYLSSLRIKAKTKFCEKKDFVIDKFEEFLEATNEIGNFTCDNLKTVGSLKEKAVDSFENCIERVTSKILELEKTAQNRIKEKQITVTDAIDSLFCELKYKFDHIQWAFLQKKVGMVDEFEERIENIKWTLEDKKLVLANEAVNAFDDILEKADEVIDEGKEEIKAEIESISYAIFFCEKLLTDFVQYCEHLTTEFVKSSEKQVVCLLHEGKKKAKVFYSEVVDSLVRGYEDKLLCDNLVLEINSSRYAYNVSMSEVNFHVVRALLTLPRPSGSVWPQLQPRLTYFKPILSNYIRTAAAQRDCLLAIEDVAGSHPEIFDLLVKIIHWLYEQDILSEESIMKWYNNPSAEPDLINAKRVRSQIAPFIKWLKEAEEQSSEEDDDD